MKKEDQEKIIDIIMSLRPYINMDGGDIEFIKYEENFVYIKLSGACADCGFIDSTIEDGILQTIKKEVPSVEGVINVSL